MNDRAKTIREIWANQRAQAYKAEANGIQSFQANPLVSLDLSDEKVRSTIPQPILAAYDYYYKQVESADWGSVAVSEEKIQDQDIVAVTVNTDGSDGWVELFDRSGEALGAARTLEEWVAWDKTEAVRALTATSDLPAELQAHQARTAEA